MRTSLVFACFLIFSVKVCVLAIPDSAKIQKVVDSIISRCLYEVGCIFAKSSGNYENERVAKALVARANELWPIKNHPDRQYHPWKVPGARDE